MKTLIVILITLSIGAVAVLTIRRIVYSPDQHLVVPADTQPVHKVPLSTPPAAGAPEVKP